ncbi:MAG: wax ester/triacylglycerol synthase family O-acyltransferase [Acidimicrobiia bacterium]|nr:wax ester/triacylglycerol synthase family O-acyltransferase [Acidimicrobiia bacterium]
MRRLTGLDAAFLAIETPTSHMHVLGVAVVDPLTAPGGFSFGTVRALIEERLPLLTPFRRRAVEVPLGLQNPLWIDDPDFDLDDHLRLSRLPPPGGPAQLAEAVAGIAAEQLDRSKPLWELTLIEGLEYGHQAIVVKVHHSAIDGLSGVELMSVLFDLEAEPATIERDSDEWVPDRVPTVQELVGHAVVSWARQPLLVARAVRNLGRSMVRLAKRVGDDAVEMTAPLNAPRLAMNAAISARRKIAFASMPLDDVKRVKNAFGVKVNDVVLAVVAGALRSYLEQRGELPDRPLTVTVPTSVRADDQRGSMGNRVSALFTALPRRDDRPG